METGLAKVVHQDESLPELVSDQLLQLAEQAEKRIEAMRRIKMSALRLTDPDDWTDQSGKPDLQGSGAEKIARAFNVSWRIGEPHEEILDEGYCLITYKGEFSMGSVTIEAVGCRYSGEKFFTDRKDENGKTVTMTPGKVNKGNVRKAALTNCLKNGITRLLGLRNLTYADLERINITREMITRFHRKGDKRAEGRSQKGGQEQQGKQAGPQGDQGAGAALNQQRALISKILRERYRETPWEVAMQWMEEFAGTTINDLTAEKAGLVLAELEKPPAESSLVKFAQGEELPLG